MSMYHASSWVFKCPTITPEKKNYILNIQQLHPKNKLYIEYSVVINKWQHKLTICKLTFDTIGNYEQEIGWDLMWFEGHNPWTINLIGVLSFYRNFKVGCAQ